jgi:hypothetical protein
MLNIHEIKLTSRRRDVDDEGKAASHPDVARLGDFGAAGGRCHSQVRGARLDAGPRRSARTCARLRHRQEVSSAGETKRAPSSDYELGR